jgi:beta-N-acetylhexosaminidase
VKLFLLILALFLTLSANDGEDEAKIKKMIGRMIVVGFDGTSVNEKSQIVKDIREYDLGGVILFDKDYKDRKKTKNVSSPKQLAKLVKDLKAYSNQPLFVSVDQEGGNVARLKPEYGFSKIPSAFKVGKMSYKDSVATYAKQSKTLEESGINMNFAPVVDMAVNPKNKVIVGLERSFGEDKRQVVEYAKVMVDEQTKRHVISVLKHFPGHGSSLGDSHEGLVDVSETWKIQELDPYKALIKDDKADVIMTAHVFNKHIDDKYPATLSYKFNTQLLRQILSFKGVIISDDLQMKAISDKYSLKERVTLAINSGVDILLFANQLDNVSVSELVDIVFEQLKLGAIDFGRIVESNARIENLFTKNSIIQKPIVFTDKRERATKEYIKKHYGLEVRDIKIEPIVIVLHWTAVSSFEDSFKRLDQEELYDDRGDIAAASKLNVSTHFLVKRDGTIYELMPDDKMARHVIGLNYSSVGIENVGGEGDAKEDLTPEQVKANVKLVRYLKAKYPKIEYLIGHYEYPKMQKTGLWLEKDASYRTRKSDPGAKFMSEVRQEVQELGLKTADE